MVQLVRGCYLNHVRSPVWRCVKVSNLLLGGDLLLAEVLRLCCCSRRVGVSQLGLIPFKALESAFVGVSLVCVGSVQVESGVKQVGLTDHHVRTKSTACVISQIFLLKL